MDLDDNATINVCFLHHSYTFRPIGDVEAHDIDLLLMNIDSNTDHLDRLNIFTLTYRGQSKN